MGRARGERILVINPGSTSTKVAVFEGDEMVAHGTLPLQGRESGGGLWEELCKHFTSDQSNETG